MARERESVRRRRRKLLPRRVKADPDEGHRQTDGQTETDAGTDGGDKGKTQ